MIQIAIVEDEEIYVKQLTCLLYTSLVIRAKLGMNTIPSARITLYLPGPSSAINTSASRIPGKERCV